MKVNLDAQSLVEHLKTQSNENSGATEPSSLMDDLDIAMGNFLGEAEQGPFNSLGEHYDNVMRLMNEVMNARGY